MALLLTQAEAAEELGTDREHVRELVRSGAIEVVAHRSRGTDRANLHPAEIIPAFAQAMRAAVEE